MTKDEDLQEPHCCPQDSTEFNNTQKESSETDSRDSDNTEDEKEAGTEIDSNSSDDEMINAKNKKSKRPSILSVSSADSDESQASIPDDNMTASNSDDSLSATDELTPGGPRGDTNP